MQYQRSKSDRPIHLFLRIPSETGTGGKAEHIIKQHNAVFHAHSKVFFCKLGAPPNEKFVDRMNAQISRGVKTFVYFSARNKKGVMGYRAALASACLRNWDAGARDFVPAYYERMKEDMQKKCLWLELNSEIVISNLDDLTLASNQRPLLDVIFETRTVTMMVEENRAAS